MGQTFYCTNWFGADTILRGGRDKDQRTVGNNRVLIRHDDGTISLRLHSTHIVTYHQDGTCTLFMGGWDSVITKRALNDYSPARVHSAYGRVRNAVMRPGVTIVDGCPIKTAIWHDTDGKTPPKIQKCRKCHGTGEIVERCDGRDFYYGWRDHRGDHQWVIGRLPGMTYRDVRTDYSWQACEICGSDKFQDCDHAPGFLAHKRTFYPIVTRDYRERYSRRPCHHGFLESHIHRYGCCACKTTGQRDYGSRTMPTPFYSHDQIRVDETGRVLGEEGEVKEFLAYKHELETFYDYRASILARRSG